MKTTEKLMMLRLPVLTLLMGIVFAPYLQAADTIITLRPASEIDAATIHLSDLFSGISAEADREIAAAPAPAKSAIYDAQALARIARTWRINWQPQSIADRAVVTRASTKITDQMISEAILVRSGGGGEAAVKREIVFDNRNIAIILPSSSSPNFVLENFEYNDVTHRFRTTVTTEASDIMPAVKVAVSGRIITTREVPILVRRLAAGTVISASDLDWITVADDRQNNDLVFNSGDVIGYELRRDTPSGQPLRSRDMAAPRMVLRGSLVTLKVASANMVLSAEGRALQDGAKGETVRVLNTHSNRTVEGTVENNGIVAVMATRNSAVQ